MPRLPTLPEGQTYRNMTDTFSGYNHRLKIADGEYYDTQNITTEYYPIMASRRKRGKLPAAVADVGGMIDKGALYYVADGALYLKGNSRALMTGLSGGEKQLVSMGAYICIFPDRMYYNTADPTDYGSMEDTRTMYLDLKHKTINGTTYTVLTNILNASEDAKEEFRKAIAGRNEGESIVLSGIGADNVGLAGRQTILKKVTEGTDTDIPYLAFRNTSFEGSGWYSYVTFGGYIPEMDFVCEASNRLWGCRYGIVDGKMINELYASALGDFKVWDRYEGTSMDSWAASVGSDGPWTGCINYMGYPTFFKEDRLHRIAISSAGAHEVTETACRGVQSGSHRSLQIVNETLFYKSPMDVCAYQGGFPQSVSQNLGDVRYDSAVAGVFGDRYYISMKDTTGKWNLFVLDTARGLWIREDNLQALSFATVGNEIYCADAQGGIWAILGSEGEIEDHIDWHAESGILYYEYPDRKYLSRFDLRINMPRDTRMRIFLEYDSSGRWEKVGEEVLFSGLGTVMIPVRPKRCDHLRIRIEGRGEMKLFSWARILEIGSDY